ncbi:DUF3568 family protein [Acidithiobacillus sp. IBUN Pt1247-S3]|uniref:DUF3568 family protein n=1 Tax=Acidithiobacillus sp. IBUN Pt1247-S3 TaxID=3166642 RepID=UPI0034E4D921
MILMPVVFATVGVALSGCAAVAGAGVGAGGVAATEAGVFADYHAYYPKPMNTVRTRVLQVFQQMGIAYHGYHQDSADQITLYGIGDDQRKISVVLNATAADITKITMGVGLFGNKVLAKQFFHLLSQRLGVPATVKPPLL